MELEPLCRVPGFAAKVREFLHVYLQSHDQAKAHYQRAAMGIAREAVKAVKKSRQLA